VVQVETHVQSAWFQLSVSMTGHAYLLEIDDLLTPRISAFGENVLSARHAHFPAQKS